MAKMAMLGFDPVIWHVIYLKWVGWLRDETQLYITGLNPTYVSGDIQLWYLWWVGLSAVKSVGFRSSTQTLRLYRLP